MHTVGSCTYTERPLILVDNIQYINFYVYATSFSGEYVC